MCSCKCGTVVVVVVELVFVWNGRCGIVVVVAELLS